MQEFETELKKEAEGDGAAKAESQLEGAKDPKKL